ncbi:hypothetical protein [uncultured Nitratireductor sp.]|uniref:hypothetical protein n=1 Tax=uncultured Nitratireductor sp. TaxID=520953 RepID=UPI0025E9F1EC|nr:hypothetical protein [uncultured Nitratireductor sp.]
MSDSSPGAISSASSNDGNLDKMIQHQKEMFNLSIKAEMAKSEHDYNMSISRKIGEAGQKA